MQTSSSNVEKLESRNSSLFRQKVSINAKKTTGYTEMPHFRCGNIMKVKGLNYGYIRCNWKNSRSNGY